MKNKIRLPSFIKGNLIGILLLCLSFVAVQSGVFAWEITPLAEAVCVTNALGIDHVNIKVTFTNNETNTPEGPARAMTVVAKDNWTATHEQYDFGTVNPGDTEEGFIKIGDTHVGNSDVTFFLDWPNGEEGKRDGEFYPHNITVGYSTKDCPPAIPTVPPTIPPTVPPTVPPIPPTEAPTVAPVINITNNIINPTPQSQVLGAAAIAPTSAPKKLASALAATGTFTDDVMNTIMFMGTLLMMLALAVYGKERKNISS